MTLNDKLTQIQTRFKSNTKPFLKELGVTVTIHEELIGAEGMPVIRTTAMLNDGASSVQATAIVGVDLNQKGMQVPQQYGSASSYGKKYALGNLFLIDDTQDSDATNTHGKDKLKDIDKAVSYIKSGGTIDAIKKKYKLTSDQEKQLTTLNG